MDDKKTILKNMIDRLTADRPQQSYSNFIAMNFDDDHMLFKSVLRLLFLVKIEETLNRNLEFEEKLSLAFPRNQRQTIFKELNNKSIEHLPQLVFRDLNFWVIVVVYIFSLGIVFYWIINNVYIFLASLEFFRILLYFIIAALPIVILIKFFPQLMEKDEIENSETVGDFVDSLVALNWTDYRKDSYAKTIEEVLQIVSDKS